MLKRIINKILKLSRIELQLENTENLRWIFITDDEFDIHADGSRRRLLWQLFCRFEVSRDLYFDSQNKRVAWDATAPIPSETGPLPVRRWPAMTLHDSEAEERVDNMAKEEGWPWV